MLSYQVSCCTLVHTMPEDTHLISLSKDLFLSVICVADENILCESGNQVYINIKAKLD